jgi:histone acetyltransferase (RNA polymerase elongator complex component)
MPLVIPVFIPHQGCPQQCLFCNQHSITGEKEERIDVAAIIRQWLKRARRSPGLEEDRPQVQVAFFGGSFTCLPITRQQELLAAVQPFLRSAQVARPDCIDREACSFLRSYGVRIVELGVQSLDDHVLQASWRGHDAEDSRRAVALLQEAGIEVGIQLMPGLPRETTGSFLQTIREVIVLAPAFVRLYPVLVVAQSGLAESYRLGDYQPLSMNKAIALTCRAKTMLTAAAIRVVRIGLQPSSTLEQALLAGPYHPAFGELVASRIWFNKIRKMLAGCPVGQRVSLQISPRDLSAVIGMKRLNILRFERLGMADKLEIITDVNMKRGTWLYAVN